MRKIDNYNGGYSERDFQNRNKSSKKKTLKKIRQDEYDDEMERGIESFYNKNNNDREEW